MASSPLLIAKLGLGIMLLLAVSLAAWARPPRRPADAVDVRRLVGSALLLYLAGGAALLRSHGTIALGAFAGGVASASLAAWLSRGGDGDDPFDEKDGPAPEPTSPDWERFDRERDRWGRRPREPIRR